MRGGKNLNDLSNQKFGRLNVLERAEDRVYATGKIKTKWKCVCLCGNIVNVFGEALIKGTSKSCGCLQKELLSLKTWKGYEEISGVYWGGLKDGAIRRNIEWNISIEYAWQTYLDQKRLCKLTKLPIHFERNFKKNGLLQDASLDRINNKKGYVEGNIQWLHKNINKLKWDWTVDELYEMCELIIKNKNATEDH